MEPAKNTQWKQANRRFYALARQCNMSREDIAATISGNYPPRVSTSELTAAELHSLCLAMQRRAVSPEEQRKDLWRKRLIAAVRHYLQLMGYQTDIAYIRSVIERAAGSPQTTRSGVPGGTALNDLSLDRLRSLYNAFTKRSKDLTSETPTPPTPSERGTTENLQAPPLEGLGRSGAGVSPLSFITAEA
mgnify:FL=1